MAASSLSDVVEAVSTSHSNLTAVLAGSSTLVAQLSAGAHADVLITADAATMDRAAADRSIRGKPVVIATNTIVLAAAPGNPGRVSGLADLARRDLLVGLCAAEVPCGALARQALDEAGIAPSVDTLELSVRSLAAKLSLGELDAGLVYGTDAATAGLPTVEAPELNGQANSYYITSVAAGRPPAALTVVGFVALGLLALPIVGLLQRAPWSSLPTLLGESEVLEALRLSLVVSVAATAACVVLGLPLAFVLARRRLRFPRVARAVVMLPMVLPPVVAGTALLFALGRRGLVGQWLDSWFGVSLPFTTAGAVVAAAFVALPFFVVTVEAALRQAGDDLDEAAATLGAGPWATLVHVALPTIRPALAAGAALSWARALGEFGATLTFAGNFPGRTRTLPLETYLALERNPEAAVAISLVLMAVALAVLVTLRDRWMPQ